MIYPVTFYAAKCDNCGVDWYDDDNGFSAMADESTMGEMLMNDEWHEENGSHYCRDCYHFDDEDVLCIHPVEPKPSDTTSTMILKILAKEKITQRQFAEACQISPQMLNDIICGRKALNVYTAIRIEKEIPLFDSRKALRSQIEITYNQLMKKK